MDGPFETKYWTTLPLEGGCPYIALQCFPRVAKLNVCSIPMSPLQKEEGEATAGAEAPPPEQQFEQKITPAQIRAWVTSGQPLNLPGFQPQLLPVVHMGARYGLKKFSGHLCKE